MKNPRGKQKKSQKELLLKRNKINNKHQKYKGLRVIQKTIKHKKK